MAVTSRAINRAGRVSDRVVREQLARILASTTFQQVDRLKRFLDFIVTETLAGRRAGLKEYAVGVEVFEKEPSFDPRTDPIVRVQARRLRARLVRYYRNEGGSDDVVIDLPKGGYAPVFARRADIAAAEPPQAPARNSVRVAPFADQSADGRLGYFCDGLTHEVVHQLASNRAIRVVEGDQAEAALVVRGSARGAGDRVRITVQLIDATASAYLWSEAIDVRIADGIAAQEQVAAAVRRRIATEVASAADGPAATTNLTARNLYLQGRYHLNQRTEDALRKAVEFFEKALVEDARHAAAHSGLSDAYRLLNHYGALPPGEVWDKAQASAAEAVRLDPESAEARTSLAHVKATHDWDWPGAEREYLAAIALDNRYATTHHWYAMSCLIPTGRLDAALDEMRLAASLDPVSSIIARDTAVVHMYRRELDAALEQCDHTIELNPHFAPAYLTLGLIQAQRGELDESIAALQRAVHLAPHTPRMQAALARTLALAGDRVDATRILRELEASARQRYVSPFEFAQLHVALDRFGPAFRALRAAVRDRCFEVLALHVDPRLDAVRSDRRFATLAAAVGLTTARKRA